MPKLTSISVSTDYNVFVLADTEGFQLETPVRYFEGNVFVVDPSSFDFFPWSDLLFAPSVGFPERVPGYGTRV